ncbi:putative leader peptide [Angustibacter luteus]|uniref:Leader peptide n=1 Tax=Angustibacter luteus TaxID=658456 RepID=A0ABW1JGF8_9ACTN
MTAARTDTAIALSCRHAARRHVDLQRVSSALCRA